MKLQLQENYFISMWIFLSVCEEEPEEPYVAVSLSDSSHLAPTPLCCSEKATRVMTAR